MVCVTGDIPVDDLDFIDDDTTSLDCPPQSHDTNLPPIVNFDDGEVEPFEDLECRVLCCFQFCSAHAVPFYHLLYFTCTHFLSTENYDLDFTRPTAGKETITSKRFSSLCNCALWECKCTI